MPKIEKEQIFLYDTTLRDGAQTTGVDFSIDDKIKIAAMLDGIGVDFIEGGYPGANPLDTNFFASPPQLNACFTAFGMTKRVGASASNDPGLVTLLQAKSQAVCFVAKSWDFHVEFALGCTLEENIVSLRESVEAAKKAGKRALIDCEHFFDGFKANPAYAIACARTAFEAGAEWVVLCDTNGGTLPHEVERIVRNIKDMIPGIRLGIHAHDDTGHAVANSLAAVRSGVRQIQGTLNGLGERCGNANLISIIPTLKLKKEFSERFKINVSDDALASLTAISHKFDDILNRIPNRQAPYVGASAFATKAGIHASALIKDPKTYEHVPPESVGNRRLVLVSTQAGKSNLITELERLGIIVEKNDPRLTRLLDEVKEREAQGLAYEGADASFYLLAQKILGKVPIFFNVERFKVNVGRRFNSKGEFEPFSEAMVKVSIGDESYLSVAEGDGPVNALDKALRKDLGRYQKYIENIRLTDFKVRIFQGGSDAITRVLIDTTDENGLSWTTVGASCSIIDASFQALVDSITYKLMRENAPV